MKFVIDRFEGEFAVVELSDGNITQIPRVVIPTEAKEGDIILLIIEVDETANRKASIERKMESLFKD
ncbi:MAG: DUF3006 domain-containing protein [Bacillota bacterium]